MIRKYIFGFFVRDKGDTRELSAVKMIQFDKELEFKNVLRNDELAFGFVKKLAVKVSHAKLHCVDMSSQMLD